MIVIVTIVQNLIFPMQNTKQEMLYQYSFINLNVRTGGGETAKTS